MPGGGVLFVWDIEKRKENNHMPITKQELAAKIWDAANKMRGKIEANDYKDFLLGFIFSYKI
jgi:type I restriction-modification system DNA methylase subunit